MNDTVSATPKKMSVKTIAVIGVLTAVTCILAPLSIPIGDVPISLTNLVIYFGLYILVSHHIPLPDNVDKCSGNDP